MEFSKMMELLQIKNKGKIVLCKIAKQGKLDSNMDIIIDYMENNDSYKINKVKNR